jgi:superfamily II DNA or RNA helicase
VEFSKLLTQLDPRPEVRGRQFELLCRWYLWNAPEYRRRFRQVWLWKEWPGAWAADAGIDLVAEERGGSLWAVQAKAYGDTYAIKKADVDSFLSESNRPHFSYRLLIATTDRIGATALRTLDGQRVPVGYLLRSQLELAQVQWPSSLDSLRPRRPKPKKPFPHVREAIKATVNGFDGAERGQLIMACGTGKTLVGLWSSERLKSARTLVLVPSLSLLAQTLREWTANATQPFDYLAVCSDDTVVGEDEFVASTAELGVPVTTDPVEISTFLRRRGRRVVFSTYQSSPQIAAAQRTRAPLFDLAIADEAHRCAGRVSSEFATILDVDQIKSRRRLFMTATPRYYTPRVRHEALQLDVEIASMDDESVFGSVVHRLSFGEAIERDLLSDYQVVVVGVTDDTYRTYAERGELITHDGERITDARTLAGQIGLAKTMRKWDLRRVVSFHGRVKAARKFSVDLPDVIAWMPVGARPRGTLWSQHVSGAMPSGRRDRLLLRFRNLAPRDRGLLSNARCLGEGVDVPSIDGVAFIDPRHSTIDIIQALGRAIRKSPDKKVGTIVLPVFLSTTTDADKALSDSSFRHVWDVLKSLRAHDETLGEELDELRQRLGASRKRIQRPTKIHLDVPTSVGRSFVRAFDARLVERTTTSWQFWFGLLLRYVGREGHAHVLQSYIDGDGHRLGAWVGKQRALHSRGALNAERVERLATLPGWSWHTHMDAWDEGFDHLRGFVDHHGHAHVPGVYESEGGYRLGGWVNAQRNALKNGRLEPARATRLAALPGWSWDLLDDAWEERFQSLRRFGDRDGHARVPSDYTDEGGQRLGAWLAKQRSSYKRGVLDPGRAERLAGLPGWSWDWRDDAWEEGFDRLRQFISRNGHARVPRNFRDDDGYKLGSWVGIQRTRMKPGTPSADARIERLSALPGWSWDPIEDAWEEGFQRLCRFRDRNGHVRLASGYKDEDGYRLARWVINQRTRFNRGTLESARVERLASLPGWSWSPDDAAWEEGFECLCRFARGNGCTRPPKNFKDADGYSLGSWAAGQRTAYKRGMLKASRIERLAAIPGWSWDPYEDAWEDGFERLRRFSDLNGHARVPSAHREQDGYSLGTWVNNQRSALRRGKLDASRVQRLAALPRWSWNPAEAAWEEGFERLRNFGDRHGHVRIPPDYKEDGQAVSAWASRQRGAHKRGVLTAGRAKQLAALPGWSWDPKEDAWEEAFERLRRFASTNGHARVPFDHQTDDGYKLGAWVNKQRSAYKRGALDPGRAKRLAALAGWSWDARR